jgi:hypothetical protein
LEPPPRKEHAVGEHRCRRGGGARAQNITDVREQKWFTTSDEDFADAKFGCFPGDPLYARETKFPPWCFGRRAYATIVAMQVAVEICIEPKARAGRALDVGILRSLAAPDHPARAARLDTRIDQGVARETTPSFKLSAKASFSASHGQELARATSAQRCNQLREQTGGKRFSAGVDLDFRFDLHGLLLTIRRTFERNRFRLRLDPITVRRAAIEIKSWRESIPWRSAKV